MSKLTIELRKARPAEARFIARNIMASIGREVFTEPFSKDDFECLVALEEVCGMPDTLYSYRNTLVATVNDIPVGSLTSYNGALYTQLRDRTFSILKARLGNIFPEGDDETREGEYYLDAMAVLPSFRGHGIAKLLIREALDVAEGLGFADVTLLCNVSKPGLLEYYKGLGFTEDGTLNCFGRSFVRMIQHLA